MPETRGDSIAANQGKDRMRSCVELGRPQRLPDRDGADRACSDQSSITGCDLGRAQV